MLTYADYVRIPDDGRRHEIVGGAHFASPTPGTHHQRISRRIGFQLYSQVELPGRGEVIQAPVDLVLSEVDVVQPDLVVVSRRRLTIVTRDAIEGAPDLLIEVLSPMAPGLERGSKKELYRRSGIPEYWIVVPDDHSVEQYVLNEGEYHLAGERSTDIEPTRIADVRVDLAQVW